MANTFFGFNTALNDHERLGSSPEDIEGLEAEEEYDALNDETFGGLEGELGDDWEVQHEQLAEIAESSRHSLSETIDQNIESFLDHLGLNDEENLEKRDRSVWAYNSNDSKNGEKDSFLNNSLCNSFQNDARRSGLSNTQILFPSPPQPRLPTPQQIPKVRTVEELERMLINQSKPGNNLNNAAPLNNQFPQHGQIPMPPARYPPGFQPVPPQHHGGPPHVPMWPQYPPHMLPGLMRMMGPPSRVPPPHMMGPPPPPGFPSHQVYHHSGYPINPHYNFPPPPRQQMNRQQAFQQQKPQRPEQQYRQRLEQHSSGDNKDEYAGLMNNREKQWLLNIQLLQINTGTPYFDDYYYTVFKERQTKNNKENQSQHANSNNQRFHQQYHNGGGRYQHQRDGNIGHHRQGQDRDRQNKVEPENPLKGKIYTPLQFENSLGKLQSPSVTAPRKIIDMDIINVEKDSDSPQCTRDSRKTKQLLLELEALYNLMLRAEDLKNPVAISNSEKLKELKQKQRLREIEAAPTPEQKQEVLKLLQQESLAVVENQQELLNKIVHGLLQDEKLISFVGIRKGKMLLLRLLPHLMPEIYSSQLSEFWIKLLLSVPLVGRRDTIGDNILPRFHIHFKRFISTCEMVRILEIVASLKETIKLENNRSTPLSHQSKSPLHFILSNKFGISSLSSIISRVEYIADACSEKHLSDWLSFLYSMTETISAVGTAIASPMEPITTQFIAKHTSRFNMLSQDRKSLIEKVFVDSD